MDGTTEPVVAVIGHPIAGNPSQFALERAFAAMSLDWRVLSFDVPAESLAAALDGAEVLGFRGVLIDESLASAVDAWYRKRGGETPQVDCLWRGEDRRWVGAAEQRTWIAEAIGTAPGEEVSGDRQSDLLWLGDPEDQSLFDPEPFETQTLAGPPDRDDIVESQWIVIAEAGGEPPPLEIDEWPAEPPETIVIDLTEGHPDLPQIRELGYKVMSFSDRRIGMLCRCLTRWTGKMPPVEVIHDAVEEYLAV